MTQSRTFIEAATAQQSGEVYLTTLLITPHDDEIAAGATNELRLVNNVVELERFERERLVWSYDFFSGMLATSGQFWSAGDDLTTEETLIKRQGNNSLKLVQDASPVAATELNTGSGGLTTAFDGTGKTVTLLVRPERVGSLDTDDGITFGLRSGVGPVGTQLADFQLGTAAANGALVVGRWTSVSVDIADMTDAGSFDITDITGAQWITNQFNAAAGDTVYLDAIYLGSMVTYQPFPFSVILPAQTGDTQPKAQLTGDAIDQLLLSELLEMTRSPTITVSGVLASDPTEVIAGPFKFRWNEVAFSGTQVSGNLETIDVLAEPFPSRMFTPLNHPGLFE